MRGDAVYCLTCSGHLAPGHTCPPLHGCRECQGLFRTSLFGPEIAERLERSSLCFACLRWTDAVTLANRPESIRINGRHYWLGAEDVSEREPRGFLGKRFLIRRFGEPGTSLFAGTLVESTNLWSQGPIPAHFLGRLPDNARWEEDPW
jgi:hypothetical protein